METKKVVCPKCGLNMEYWTTRNYINCTKCNEVIEVEPCIEEEIEVVDENKEGD